MSKVQIEWGNLHRTEAIEEEINQKAERILSKAPQATHLLVHLKVTNSLKSAGVPEQKVTLELRLPHHQDIRSEKKGRDFHKTLNEAKSALLSQLERKKH